MRWQPWTTVVVVLASGALAWWQHHEYLHARKLTRETLHGQAHSVMNALVGGIESHRNRGRFFADQMQGSLEGLVQTPNVILAVAFRSDDGRLVLSAGKTEVLNTSSPIVAGDFWDPAQSCSALGLLCALSRRESMATRARSRRPEVQIDGGN